MLGRSDNSIKNYWNSTLLYKKDQFERDLESYLKRVLSSEQNWTCGENTDQSLAMQEQQGRKQQIVQCVLQQYIRAVHE